MAAEDAGTAAGGGCVPAQGGEGGGAEAGLADAGRHAVTGKLFSPPAQPPPGKPPESQLTPGVLVNTDVGLLSEAGFCIPTLGNKPINDNNKTTTVSLRRNQLRHCWNCSGKRWGVSILVSPQSHSHPRWSPSPAVAVSLGQAVSRGPRGEDAAGWGSATALRPRVPGQDSPLLPQHQVPKRARPPRKSLPSEFSPAQSLACKRSASNVRALVTPPGRYRLPSGTPVKQSARCRRANVPGARSSLRSQDSKDLIQLLVHTCISLPAQQKPAKPLIFREKEDGAVPGAPATSQGGDPHPCRPFPPPEPCPGVLPAPNRSRGERCPPVSWGLLRGRALPRSHGDRTGQDWTRVLRCPDTQAQGDVPRAAPSVRNCQNLTLFFTCLFRVISYSVLKCRPRHFPIYFLAFYISPCFSSSQCSPSPVPHSPAPGGEYPQPVLPGRSASLQPAAGWMDGRRRDTLPILPPFFFFFLLFFFFFFFPSPHPNSRQWFVMLQFEDTRL
ncbi:uncharacterized protein LOC126039803 [Accipiter gentilis]|uniref:uncharacterized protein LOC126039803 n=1 Tax=Astur gentilis TaxID=8957 RepID=UPI00211090A2|nr:uncharacterized protein LOC126039803 [Accipiter gentilis]